MLRRIAEKAEHRFRRVAGLFFHDREIDGLAVDARRRTGLESSDRKLQFAQPVRQADGGRVTRAAGRVVLQADMDESIQEGASGQHDSRRFEAQPNLGHDASHAVTFDGDVVDCLLKQCQVWLVFEAATDRCLVEHAVRLSTRRAHGRPLARIQDTELDAALVRGLGHRAAKRIHFLDEVSLTDATDRRIAAHLPKRLDVVREQQGRSTHAGSGERGFGAGMAATDNDHVKTGWIQHFGLLGDSGEGAE